MDNRAYYDDFAGWYENERGGAYHRMLDELETNLVRELASGRTALEVGCGTGLILGRVNDFAQAAIGVDISAAMLSRARARGLDVAQGSATALPFAADSFDCTYSFKVLPHIEDIEAALAEMARVTKPGGTVLAEFYNPWSLRYLVKRLKRPTAISSATTDDAVFTRYDSPSAIRRHLPASLQIRGWRGIRIVTPISHVHRIWGLGSITRRVEFALTDNPIAARLGGFLVAVLEKR